MEYINRLLSIELPPFQSAFLWGARKTGKSTYLRHQFPQSVYDEVQRIPLLLDEVHALIEAERLSFILCGSSARKLKRGAANLLGGRAWRYEMSPLSAIEVPDFDLLRCFNTGMLPSHYYSTDYERSLQGYIFDYLQEEIRAEGYVRDTSKFHVFLLAASYVNGQLLNYSNIARDCGVSLKTVKAYFDILEDTLLGSRLYPFKQRGRSDLIVSAPKFYFFDLGLVHCLSEKKITSISGADAGHLFEHWVYLELLAYKRYMNPMLDISYWRKKSGVEVDFVLQGGRVALEVKITRCVKSRDVAGLLAFASANPQVEKLVVVCCEPYARCVEVGDVSVLVLPWQDFIERCWSHQLITD